MLTLDEKLKKKASLAKKKRRQKRAFRDRDGIEYDRKKARLLDEIRNYEKKRPSKAVKQMEQMWDDFAEDRL